jgi:hypothetical protein
LLAVAAALGLAPGMLLAQQATTINGRVTNEAGSPLAGVSVSVPTIRSGALTDAEGNYSFTIPAERITAGASLPITARRIGYSPKTTNVVADRASITVNFTLVASAAQLDEIVVTALGIEKEKRRWASRNRRSTPPRSPTAPVRRTSCRRSPARSLAST